MNNVCFSQLNEPADVYKQEYQKGEISGLYLTANFLPLTIDAVKAEIEDKQKAEEEAEKKVEPPSAAP